MAAKCGCYSDFEVFGHYVSSRLGGRRVSEGRLVRDIQDSLSVFFSGMMNGDYVLSRNFMMEKNKEFNVEQLKVYLRNKEKEILTDIYTLEKQLRELDWHGDHLGEINSVNGEWENWNLKRIDLEDIWEELIKNLGDEIDIEKSWQELIKDYRYKEYSLLICDLRGLLQQTRERMANNPDLDCIKMLCELPQRMKFLGPNIFEMLLNEARILICQARKYAKSSLQGNLDDIDPFAPKLDLDSMINIRHYGGILLCLQSIEEWLDKCHDDKNVYDYAMEDYKPLGVRVGFYQIFTKRFLESFRDEYNFFDTQTDIESFIGKGFDAIYHGMICYVKLYQEIMEGSDNNKWYPGEAYLSLYDSKFEISMNFGMIANDFALKIISHIFKKSANLIHLDTNSVPCNEFLIFVHKLMSINSKWRRFHLKSSESLFWIFCDESPHNCNDPSETPKKNQNAIILTIDDNNYTRSDLLLLWIRIDSAHAAKRIEKEKSRLSNKTAVQQIDNAEFSNTVIQAITAAASRAECLPFEKSFKAYAKHVFTEILDGFLDIIKNSWNQIDDLILFPHHTAFHIYSIAAIIEYLSTNFKYHWLISEQIETYNLVIHKMINLLCQSFREKSMKLLPKLVLDHNVIQELDENINAIAKYLPIKICQDISMHCKLVWQDLIIKSINLKVVTFNHDQDRKIFLENCKDIVQSHFYQFTSSNNLDPFQDIIHILTMPQSQLQKLISEIKHLTRIKNQIEDHIQDRHLHTSSIVGILGDKLGSLSSSIADLGWASSNIHTSKLNQETDNQQILTKLCDQENTTITAFNIKTLKSETILLLLSRLS